LEFFIVNKTLIGVFVLFYSINSSTSCEVLYDGKDVLVEASSFGSKNIWICFNEIKAPHGYEIQDHSKTHFKPGDHRWGQPFLNNNRIDAINVVNLANHWYQTNEMKEVIPIIRKYIEGRAYENVITYGLSHGGCGAVLFAGELKANRVLALGAQLQFKDIERMGFIQWQKSLNLKPIFSPTQHFNTCDFYIFFGSQNAIDRAIVEDVDGLPLIVSDPRKKHIFPLKTPEHNVANYLHQHVLLKRTVLLVDKGDHDELVKCIDPFIDKPDSLKPLIHIPLGKSFDVKSPIILGDGFYDMEDEGLWSSDKGTFTIAFPEKDKKYKIDIDYHAFVSPENPNLSFRLMHESDEVFKGIAEHDSGQSFLSFTYTPGDVTTSFNLETNPAKSPLELGISEDSRVLGLFLKSINITKA